MWTQLGENFLGHGSTEMLSTAVSQVAFTSVLGFMSFAFPSGHRLFAGSGDELVKPTKMQQSKSCESIHVPCWLDMFV